MPEPQGQPAPLLARLPVAIAIAAILVGIGMRLYCFADPGRAFFDAHLYTAYVRGLAKFGVADYPFLFELYLAYQSEIAGAVLPPTRCTYILAGHAVASLTGCEPIDALRTVSFAFNLAMLPLAFGFLRRLFGSNQALLATAVLALLPTQIFMARGALIDGFFAFWTVATLWLFWENLQRPRSLSLLTLFALCGGLLVATKETSFFVFTGFGALVLANRWLRFGRVTAALVGAVLAAGVLGWAFLALMAGGLDQAIAVFQLLVEKAYTLDFAVQSGDGPWFRYPFDLLLVNPLPALLAFASLFCIRRTQRAAAYLACFWIATMVVMSCVRYGMNLRYGNMWDVGIAALAVLQIRQMSERMPCDRAPLVVACALLLTTFSSGMVARRLVLEANIGELVAIQTLPELHVVKLTSTEKPHPVPSIPALRDAGDP